MNSVSDVESPFSEIKKVTVLGAVVNLLLSAVKILVGLFSGSLALIADGIHSVSDLLTDLIVFAGAYFSTKPPDESHPYGHGRFETFAALLVSIFLVGTGAKISYEAGLSLYRHESFIPGWSVILVAIVSIISKEALFQVTKVIARRTQSPSVLANAWHHRSDALSSVAVLAGGIAGLFGWGHGDQLAGCVVGLMVIGAGGRIAFDSLGELMERSIGEKDIETIIRCLEECEGVLQWHRLRTRKVGREIFLDVHVLVNVNLSIGGGHEIADHLEETISRQIVNPINFTIHVEPITDKGA